MIPQYNSSLEISLKSLFLIFLFWFAVTYFGFVSPVFVPNPLDVWNSFVKLLFEENLVFDIYITLFRVFVGSIVSIVLGIATAVLIFVNPFFKKHLEHLVGISRYVPIPAIFPLLILWFGIGETSKVLVVFLSIYPYLVLLFLDNFKSIPKELVEKAVVHGADLKFIVSKILLPYALPQLIDSCRISIASGWAAIALAEVLGANAGLGHVIIEAKRFIQTPKIFVGIMLFVFFGLVTDWLLKKIYDKFVWVKQ
ncbi:MAG: ABC transporter permease [Candidatus Diapherotrites archaeon]|nr:ABC transporter permease [Candidatus Diapherotrites archaeon]